MKRHCASDLEQGRIIENRELVNMAPPLARSKRHIEIALPPGMAYRAGDYLAVLPRNPARDVDRALRRFGVAADTQILIHKRPSSATALPSGYPVSAAEILASYVELGQAATRAQVGQLARATGCPSDKAGLEALSQPAAYEAEIMAKRVSVLDLLERFPGCELTLGAFLGALPPMRTRQYSISSSPLWDPHRCSLTVAILNEPSPAGGHRHLGVASTFLAGLEDPASAVRRNAPASSVHHRNEDQGGPKGIEQ
ncbi:MAG: hypothetical protein JO110_16060 [Acetobacteraceae bacterium]|nr:hypothetical protein [Acetobacteraceae bacterium]